MHLPQDIYFHIFDYLQIYVPLDCQYDEWSTPEEEKIKLRTLRAICSASKALNAAAKPILYRVIDFRLHTELLIPGAEAYSLWCLLRTLINDSDAASYVRHVHVNEIWELGAVVVPKELVDMIDSICAAMAFRKDQFNISQHLLEDVREGLSEHVPDAGLALLLLLCQDIRSLSILDVLDAEESIMLKVLSPADSADSSQESQTLSWSSRSNREEDEAGTASLGKLHCVHISYPDTECFTEFETWAAVTSLPALETFSGVALGLLNELHLPPNYSLKTLDLRETNIAYSSWSGLFTAFPKLETFKLNWGSEMRNETGVEIWYTGLGNALRQHARDLRHLELDMGCENRHDPDFDHGRLGSLSCLAALTHLDMPRAAFFAVEWSSSAAESLPLIDALPTSLESLALSTNSRHEDHGCEAWINAGLLEVMSDGRFHSLNRVSVDREGSIAQPLVPTTWKVADAGTGLRFCREQPCVLERIEQSTVSA